MAKEQKTCTYGAALSHTAANKWACVKISNLTSVLNALPRDDESAKLTRMNGKLVVVSYNTETGTYEFVPNFPLHMWVIIVMSQSAALPATGVSNTSDYFEATLDEWFSDEYAYQVLGESVDDFKNFGIYGADYLNVSNTKIKYQFTPRKNQEIVSPEAGSGSVEISTYLIVRHSGNKSIAMIHRFLDAYKLEYLISQRKIKLGSWQG